jgi:DNA repair exonuclease SbcCD ATPase subunit
MKEIKEILLAFDNYKDCNKCSECKEICIFSDKPRISRGQAETELLNLIHTRTHELEKEVEKLKKELDTAIANFNLLKSGEEFVTKVQSENEELKKEVERLNEENFNLSKWVTNVETMKELKSESESLRSENEKLKSENPTYESLILRFEEKVEENKVLRKEVARVKEIIQSEIKRLNMKIIRCFAPKIGGKCDFCNEMNIKIEAFEELSQALTQEEGGEET